MEAGARFLSESGRSEMALAFRSDPSDRPAAGSYTGNVAVTLAYN